MSKKSRSEREFIDVDHIEYGLKRLLRSNKTKPERFEEIINDYRKMDSLPKRREDQKVLFNAIVMVLEDSVDINNEFYKTVEEFIEEAKNAKSYIRRRLDKHREERKKTKRKIKKLKEKIDEVMIHIGLKEEKKEMVQEEKKEEEGVEDAEKTD